MRVRHGYLHWTILPPGIVYFLVPAQELEKNTLGRLMATHGVECFHDHVLPFPMQIDNRFNYSEPLQNIDPRLVELAYPEVTCRMSLAAITGR